MKRLRYLLATLMLLAWPFIGVLQTRLAAADSTNLMANASVETSTTGINPDAWTPNTWGASTTTLATTTDAHTGTKALNIATTSRTSGDAKWIPATVAVTAGQQYTYTDFYKSTVATELDAAYTNASGTVSYVYLGAVQPSTAWQQASASFTVPAGIQSVSVMHILAGAGSLTTDDFSLTTAEAPVVVPAPTSGNLIANPSFETASGTTPANWQSGGWGTNTASYTYNATGRTGNRSVTTSISAYTSGDAKWYPSAVAVTAGHTYTYADYYTATTATRVVAAYTSSTSDTTYVELAGAPSTSTWAQYTANLTVPAGVSSVTIFHLLSAVGSLTVDDSSLTDTTSTTTPPVTPPASTDTITNASVETSTNGTTPDGWQADGWGTNTASYTYVNDGHTGSKSVRTTISSYTDGDAKWYFTPVNLTAGKTYTFSAWLKATAQAHAVVAYTMGDNSTQYANLPNPGEPSSTTWQQYSANFEVPSGAKSATVYMLIASVGWLQTDDYSLSTYTPTGFNTAMVSLTFDDGWQNIYTNALPLLKKYNQVSTQYIISGYIGANEYMTKAQIQAFQTQGSEIGSHTVSHPDLTTLSAANLTTELKQSQTRLRNLFGSSVATTIASPYGAYNNTVIAAMKKYYVAHRSTDVGFNSKDNFNPYNIVVQNVDASTTNAQVEAWVNQAIAEKTWLVLVYHQVENTIAPADIYAVSTANLDAQLGYIQSSGISVKTMSQALAAVNAQL